MDRIYIDRAIKSNLTEAAKDFPAIVLTGARQTGKSTLLQKNFSSYNYVTLDNLLNRKMAKDDPELFLENNKAPCIIDEIQYAPELLSYIKIQIDQHREKTGQYLLTGSQVFPLMKGLSESLAGRAAIFELYGFSVSEYHFTKRDTAGLFQRIFTGSYPDPLIHGVNINIFYSSYIQTYLERDIRAVENVQDLSIFHQFIEVLAARAGSIINYTEISRTVGISQTTVKRWLSILENSRIIYLLRPYFANINKRIIKSPKLYFMDCGLLSYLLRYQNSKTLESGPMNGAVLENFVITEILKNIKNQQVQTQIYFFRDSNDNEIDLIMDYGSHTSLYEIKLNKTIQQKHYQQLEKQDDIFPNVDSRNIISLMESKIKISRKTTNIPVWDIDTIY